MNDTPNDCHTVECYSGTEYAERPRAFIWEGERHHVAEVLHSWRFPDGPGFRIRTTGGLLFELIYREPSDCWEIHPIADDPT